MQRVTGALEASEALRPLDSLLVVRVLDQRYEEIAGVTVRWFLPRRPDGAALRVINTVTDSLGLSRAMFIPGRSADAQGPRAEVAGVGAIDFTVVVPVARIQVTPERSTVWAGEDVTVGAELRDVAGTLLAGGTLFWAATDTSAVRVRRADPAHARVTGALAGSTRLIAWTGAGEVRDTGSVLVRPVATGQFVRLDGLAPPPLALELTVGDYRDSVPVRDSRFSQRVDVAPDAEVDLHAVPIADTARFHEVRLRLSAPRELQDLSIVLVPKVARIDGGTYDGREIPIDVIAAMRRSGRSAPFWRLVPISGRGPRKLLGWKESDMPLHIAFDRNRSSDPILAEDSTAFWTIARDMERDLGVALFEPAQISDTALRYVVPVEITAQESQGHTFVSWGQPGDAADGVLLFRRSATLRDSHVVTHELLHLLGFGHSTGWPTIAQAVGGTEPRLTPYDVAYVQLALRLRRLQERTGARPGLPVAVQ